MSQISRRALVNALGPGAMAAKAAAQILPVNATQAKQVIGVQIGSISFLDEPAHKVMDVIQEKACVNTLCLATFTYGKGIAGRQLKGHPLPDPGVQNYANHFSWRQLRHAPPSVLQEYGYAELPYTGLSPGYVYRETKRSVEGAAGTKTQIWPGIDIDISNMDINFSRCTPPRHQRCDDGSIPGRRTGPGHLTQVLRNETGEPGRRWEALREMKIAT